MVWGQRDRFRSTNESVFLTMDEDEYEALLRANNYGDHAVEMELETLRKFKSQLEARRNPPESEAQDLDEDGKPIKSSLELSVERIMKRKQPAGD